MLTNHAYELADVTPPPAYDPGLDQQRRTQNPEFFPDVNERGVGAITYGTAILALGALWPLWRGIGK